MANLKKYTLALANFVLILTVTLAISCQSGSFAVHRIEGKEIGVTSDVSQSDAIEKFIKPFRDSINTDLMTVLAYSPETLDKSGQWQSTIGNLMADETLQRSNKIFEAREKESIDFCLLNHGGIRSIIPQGNITTRTAFEIMPFENSVIVAKLDGPVIMELLQYIIDGKKAHPISGIKFTIGKDNTPKNITIRGAAFDITKSYNVVTSDYLISGGDNMNFFKKATRLYDLDYKLRNILIDYLKDVDTIAVPRDIRISVEPAG